MSIVPDSDLAITGRSPGLPSAAMEAWLGQGRFGLVAAALGRD